MKLFENIKNNSYLRNIVTLMSGTALSQGILIAATPILSRLFTPENFGILAIYVAIVGIVSLVSSWKYELAIILPEDDQDAEALVFLSIIITIITTILTFILITLFRKHLIKMTNNVELFIWLVPIGILISGLLQIYTSWGTRKEQYKFVANTKIAQSVSTVLSQLSLGFFKTSSISLIIGNVIGIFSSLIYLLVTTSKKHFIHLNKISKRHVYKNFKDYQNFPKFQSTSVLVNSISQHLPIFLLTLFYSAEMAGFYSLTHRALTTPVRLIGNSVRQVYYQRASRMFGEKKNIKNIFINSTFGLAKITIIPFILIGIFARPLFVFVFGSEWLVSGIYAQLIILYIFALTINPPSVMTLQILGKQRLSMFYVSLLRFSLLSMRFVRAQVTCCRAESLAAFCWCWLSLEDSCLPR